MLGPIKIAGLAAPMCIRLRGRWCRALPNAANP
jgi:hypothetical protein